MRCCLCGVHLLIVWSLFDVFCFVLEVCVCVYIYILYVDASLLQLVVHFPQCFIHRGAPHENVMPTSVTSAKNLPLLPPLHGTDTGVEGYHVSAHLKDGLLSFQGEKGLEIGKKVNWDNGCFFGNKMAVSY